MGKFKELGIESPILRIIDQQGFSEPTEIQTKTIPLGLAGKDLVAMSATGSGKTLVFATVIMHNIDRDGGLQAVILTPTRELTEQVAQVLRIFAKSKHLEVVEIIGGVAIGPQINKLKTANIVVGTPGRVLDHLGKRTMKLNSVNQFILDEADRMFDMGFIKDVEKIMGYCPYNKQMMLFSATINKAVLRLAEKHMHNPMAVNAENFVNPSLLKQVYYEVDGGLKFSLLVHLIKTEKRGLVMVFCNSRRNVDIVNKNLRNNDIESHALHGGMVQSKRSRVIKDFHSNKVHILVCTDVAARGLDIKGVEHIYNYNIPRDPTDYIHRIGRTARAGEAGKAISLLSTDEHHFFRRVVNKNKVNIQQIDTPLVEKIRLKKGRGRDSSGRGEKPTNSRKVKPAKKKSTGFKLTPPKEDKRKQTGPKRKPTSHRGTKPTGPKKRPRRGAKPNLGAKKTKSRRARPPGYRKSNAAKNRSKTQSSKTKIKSKR